ncbi:fungal-specific transcription factor domain-containing protein [Dactylonectria estremocensis]|uniref:Fungal-specific transcription factor domain-containing protein n=1 Tax=Dactylonectria estremocensis TaxID=1079267 RepID=A0A9P9E151_9HYPO|nr:fungal-specific transcription factor domain-containing protein [Dactylonectria estremocensis]
MTADHAGISDAATPQSPAASAVKRGSSAAENRRSKRAKYAPVACNECKKKKLKCIKDDSEDVCRRCLTSEVNCVFTASTQLPQTQSQSHPKQQQQPAQGTSHDASTDKRDDGDRRQDNKLSDEVARLREQVASLTASLREINNRTAHMNSRSPALTTQQNPSPVYMSEHNSRPAEPRQPQFVGPTRSTFSLRIAETSLTRMGIQTGETPESRSASPASSEERSPRAAENQAEPSQPESDCLLGFELDEIQRLLYVYEEEVESVYPFTNIKEVAMRVPDVLDYVRNVGNTPPDPENPLDPHTQVELKDVQIVKVALATSIVMEAKGSNALSRKLVASVESVVCRVSGEAKIDLKEVQIMTILSIYFFHCGEELLAWRAIGISSREVLEIGLHRRAILLENFKEHKERDLAVRTFWCVYVLDRRWSFGTSLSFALIDKDIDPELPEPGDDYPYLRCMVSYGRLCSKVWEALPPFELPSQFIPKDSVAFLDFLTQNWLNSIPADLQLRHPRLGLAPRNQPRVLHRLRMLLYLRGNHMRTLIHRHHLLSTSSIKADMQGARLVLDIAQDTIEVLVHLNDTSDIYARQQNAFNYFLLSALAAILLAVCHAPNIFAEPCRESFLKAVQLVKSFARDGHASRRLWKTIRGLLPGFKVFGLQGDSDKTEAPQTLTDGDTSLELPVSDQTAKKAAEKGDTSTRFGDMWETPDLSAHIDPTVPDMLRMGGDLISLFDAFGQTHANHEGTPVMPLGFSGLEEQGMLLGDPDEISRRFQGLI